MQRNRKLMLWAIAPVILAAVPGTAWLVGRDSTAATATKANLRLVADLSDSRLKMYEADTLVWQYPISPGTSNYPTPKGEYMIRKLVWNPRWTPPPGAAWARKETAKGPGEPGNPMKVVKIFFREPDFFIHGTPSTNSLGTAASHGCLRMDPNEAGDLALLLMNNAGIQRDWDWVKSILDLGESRTVQLGQSVPMSVVE